MTYTYEVVDDPEQAAVGGELAGGDLLAKSRQIMVPQVRPGGAASPNKSAATASSATARLTVGKVSWESPDVELEVWGGDSVGAATLVMPSREKDSSLMTYGA